MLTAYSAELHNTEEWTSIQKPSDNFLKMQQYNMCSPLLAAIVHALPRLLELKLMAICNEHLYSLWNSAYGYPL